MVHIAVYIRTTTQPFYHTAIRMIFSNGEKAKRNPFSTIGLVVYAAHTLNNLYYRLETYPLSTANNRNNNKLCSIPQ